MDRILPETVNYIRKKYKGIPILKAFEDHPEDLFGIIEKHRTNNNYRINITPGIIDQFSKEIQEHYQKQINAKKKGNAYHAAANGRALTQRLRGPIVSYTTPRHTITYDDPAAAAAANEAAAAAAAAHKPLTPRSHELPSGNGKPSCPQGSSCAVMGGRARTRRAKSRCAKSRRVRRTRHS